jgi:hypothetical protein
LSERWIIVYQISQQSILPYEEAKKRLKMGS